MAKLENNTRRNTKKLTLPSSTPDNEVWVEIYTDALAGDFEEMANVGDKRGTAIFAGIVNIIKDWNFEKDDGTKEDITLENVRRLKQSDILFIVTEVEAYDSLNSISIVQKKNIVNTSSQNQSENTPTTPTA